MFATPSPPVIVKTLIDPVLREQLQRVASLNDRSVAAELRCAVRKHVERTLQSAEAKS